MRSKSRIRRRSVMYITEVDILYAIVLNRDDTLTMSINSKSQSNLIASQCFDNLFQISVLDFHWSIYLSYTAFPVLGLLKSPSNISLCLFTILCLNQGSIIRVSPFRRITWSIQLCTRTTMTLSSYATTCRPLITLVRPCERHPHSTYLTSWMPSSSSSPWRTPPLGTTLVSDGSRLLFTVSTPGSEVHGLQHLLKICVIFRIEKQFQSILHGNCTEWKDSVSKKPKTWSNTTSQSIYQVRDVKLIHCPTELQLVDDFIKMWIEMKLPEFPNSILTQDTQQPQLSLSWKFVSEECNAVLVLTCVMSTATREDAIQQEGNLLLLDIEAIELADWSKALTIWYSYCRTLKNAKDHGFMGFGYIFQERDSINQHIRVNYSIVR